MTVWTDRETTDFWRHNTSDLAGDKTARLIMKLTKRYIGCKVLDVGAGSGALMRLIPQSVGVDVAPRTQGIQQASIVALPFRDHTFDTVFCCDLLEHLPSQTLHHGLSEVARVLLPGGFLVVTVPYEENLDESTCYCPKCGSEFHRWGHTQSFEKCQIATLLAGAGLSIQSLRVLPLGLLAEHPGWSRQPFRFLYQAATRSLARQDWRMLVVAKK